MATEGNELVFSSKEKIADFSINQWMGISSQSVAERGRFCVALSGGKTPVDFYKRLAFRGNDLPWEKTHIFLADERFVPTSHKDSNYGMIKEHLLDHVSVPGKNVHAISTEGVTLEQSAREYEEDIRGFFRTVEGQFPAFDLIMLGIGEDGHTASLFPGTAFQAETKRLAVPITNDKIPQQRISLTFPVLTNARRVIFLVTGEGKAPVLKEIVENRDSTLPAALVRQRCKETYLVTDKSAASLLSGPTVEREASFRL